MLKDILLFLELNSQFGKLTDRIERTPVPELVKGALTAFVNFAYTEFHSWHLISMDSTLLRE